MDEIARGANVRRNLVAAFVSVAIFAPLLYMAIDRGLPFERLEGKIYPAEPKPGDWIEVTWQVKINRVCKGIVQRQIIMHDGTILNYDPVPAFSRQEFTADRLYRQFPLSSRAIPGKATYRAFTCYVCNPLQHWWPICVQTPDITFTIGEPAPAAPPQYMRDNAKQP